MRYPTRFRFLLMLVLIAGCASSDDAVTNERTAAMTTVTAVVATTTTAATTTTVSDLSAAVDTELVASFAAKVRDRWAEAESMVGFMTPDLSDDEIAVIGTSICEYFAAHPLAVHSSVSKQERMEAYIDVSVIVADALGLPYDPTLEDAGFESRADARKVMAFKYTLEPADNGGLCPVPATGPGSMPCAGSSGGCDIFASPWRAAASPQ